MAQNVKFIKGDTAKINGTSIVDGQLLYDTTTGQHYIDNESTRVEVGKPVVNTSAEVLAITEDNIPCGTKPVKELIKNLNNEINTRVNSDANLQSQINNECKASDCLYYGVLDANWRSVNFLGYKWIYIVYIGDDSDFCYPPILCSYIKNRFNSQLILPVNDDARTYFMFDESNQMRVSEGSYQGGTFFVYGAN